MGNKSFFFVSDCSVLGCRLVLIMEDLLWVLIDDQLKAALHFADSLSGLLKRATEETQKIKGARKLEVNDPLPADAAFFTLQLLSVPMRLGTH